jgi:hypothetical protein
VSRNTGKEQATGGFSLQAGGLIDYCAASDDLRADVGRLREGNFEVDGPTDGGRRRPDGILQGLPFHNYLIGATDSCCPPRISLDLPFGSF